MRPGSDTPNASPGDPAERIAFLERKLEAKDKTIAAALSRAIAAPVDDRSKRGVSGGSISQCWRY